MFPLPRKPKNHRYPRRPPRKDPDPIARGVKIASLLLCNAALTDSEQTFVRDYCPVVVASVMAMRNRRWIIGDESCYERVVEKICPGCSCFVREGFLS
jgi:hypothetical protein